MQSLKIAELSDVEFATNLVFEMFKSSIYSKYSYFNRADVEKVIEDTIKGDPNDGSVVLLQEGSRIIGILICSAVYQMYNRKEKTAVEIAFWITPDARTLAGMKLMLKAYKYWATKTKCTSILYGKLKGKEEVESYIMRKL